MVELGTATEMVDFFNYLNRYLKTHRDSELLDRLYKKYVRFEELDETSLMVERLKESLSPDVEGRFLKYISGIETCIESAKIFYSSWGVYQPVKVSVTDVPGYIQDKNRPLEHYDALSSDDPPFWLR